MSAPEIPPRPTGGGEPRKGKAMALVDGWDEQGRHWGEYREVELPLLLSDAHREAGQRLRRARLDCRLSQREMMVRSHVHFGRLSRIEAGVEEPTEQEWSALWQAIVEAREAE